MIDRFVNPQPNASFGTMAYICGGSFAAAKAESLVVPHKPLASASSSSSSSPSSSSSRNWVQLRRRECIVRCEVGFGGSRSNDVSGDQRLDFAPVSALEQLKINAADRYTKERSSIMVIGLSVHTAPVEMREKLAIPEAEWPQAIRELCSLNHIEEAAVLSTCNRTEIYVVALSQHRGVKEVTEWMSKKSGLPVSELSKHRFLLYNKDATEHLFEVSSGLDSLVLGEGQILAQVKQVVKVGQGVIGFGRKISGLFKHAITVGKRVRTETSIASGAVSVSSAAVELAVMKIPEPGDFAAARVLVVGAGKMGKLVIKHLSAKGCKKMIVVNRTEDKVSAIREESKGVEIIFRPFDQLLTSAAEADIVFTCTASETPLFLKQQVDEFPPASHVVDDTRLFLDISLPRNVDPSVNDSRGSKVYNIDDLKEVVDANKEGRLRKAMEAQAIIVDESQQFEEWRDSLETVPTIKKLRAYAERIRMVELEKCLSKLDDDVPKKTRRAVEDLSRGIVNKLLRGPTEHLRCNSDNGRTLSVTLENMHALDRIFGLGTELSLLEEKIKAKVEQNKR